MDWIAEIRTASAAVEAWILAVAPDDWLAPRAGGWSDRDLLGHLAAWSDLLMDQVEALQQERPETVDAIDVHVWNAEQVARRRRSTVEETIAAWRRAAQRVDEVIAGLAPCVGSRRWQVSWTPQQVCIDDLLDLWLVHLDQHRSRLTRAPG
jgi:hypothetical protein